MLAAATANCLSASLFFCVSKEETAPHSLKTTVRCKMVRNENERLRVGGLEVRLTVSGELEQSVQMQRCLGLFEDFCVVTASVRQGVPVAVTVDNEAGEILHQTD